MGHFDDGTPFSPTNAKEAISALTCILFTFQQIIANLNTEKLAAIAAAAAAADDEEEGGAAGGAG